MRIGYYASGFFGSILQLSALSWVKSEWRDYLQRKQMREWIKKTEAWNKLTQNQRVTIEIQKDVRINLSTHSELAKLIYIGSFERNERIFFNRFVRRGEIVLDIGANVGLFTLIAAKLVGNSGHVYAFEPSPKTCNELKANIQLNRFSNVTVIDMAATATSGEFELRQVKNGFDAWSSLANVVNNLDFDIIKIHGISLDNFVAEQNLNNAISLIKIDAEGWESEILAGGQSLLTTSHAPLLQIEFADEAAKMAGTTSSALYERVVDLGYSLYSYDPQSNRLVSSPLKESYSYENLFAVKNIDMANQKLAASTRPKNIW